MNLNEYMIETRRTAAGKTDLIVCALGLAGESGEFCDHVKKYLAQGHTLDREKIKLELGDILWYVARAADEADFTLDEIAEANVAKLRARYPEGFDPARSMNR